MLPLIAAMHRSRDRIEVIPSAAFLHRFGRSSFFAAYDGTRIHLDEIRQGIAVIPFIANVAPLLWLSGEHWSIEVLDATFAGSLAAMKAEYRSMYRNVAWEGSIVADRIDPPTTSDAEPVDVLLFSGGVDSVYTASLRRERTRLWTTIRGSDIALNDERTWSAVRAETERRARTAGEPVAFIASNFRTFLDVPTIERLWPSLGDWWSAIQHGPGLIGLTAPLVPQDTRSSVLISSTHREGIAGPLGSTRRLDEAVRWGHCGAVHVGHTVTRQEKVAAIVEVSRREPMSLRVCFANAFADGRNCGRCEKCLRTAAGIVAEGGVPSDFGIAIDGPSLPRRIRRGFTLLLMPSSPGPRAMWEDIRTRLRTAVATGSASPTQRELAQVLGRIDLARYQVRAERLQSLHRRAVQTSRRWPAAALFLKRLRSRSRRLLDLAARPSRT